MRRAALAVVLASTACRHGGGEATLSEAVTPPAAFLEVCNGYAQLAAADKEAFGQVVGNLFNQLPTDVMASHSCASIWTEALEVKKLEVISTVADVAVLRAFVGVPDLLVSLTIGAVPRHVEVLGTLDATQIGISRSSTAPGSPSPEQLQAMVAAIARNPRLKMVMIRDLPISDFGALAPLENVEILSLTNDPISDLSFLRRWQNLKELDVTGCRIEDLTPLADVLSLEKLTIAKNRIGSIDPLLHLANLTKLVMSYNPVRENILALSFLNLTYLDVEGSQIVNLEPLRNLPLKNLVIRNNPVTSLEPLSAMPLRFLLASWTEVSDLSPLAGNTSLVTLSVGHTHVTDISALPPNLGSLDLEALSVTDFCPAVHLPHITNIRLPSGAIVSNHQIESLCHD